MPTASHSQPEPESPLEQRPGASAEAPERPIGAALGRAEAQGVANPNRSAQALLGLTALILVLAPGSGGAVTPLATGLFALGGAAILAILAAEPALLAPAQNPRLRWLGVAMGGVLALGALQLLPLGPLLAYLSPASGALRTPQGGADSLGCIALYPDHARQALVGPVVAAAIFLVCARALPKKGPEHLAKLLILAALDNLVKGASGVAVQNFNLMCGFDERTALL